MTGTYTGKIVDLNNFSSEDIHVMDIAVSLSRQRRYAGHTIVPWSVGQHLILCGMISEMLSLGDDVRKSALLHDVPEVWLQDIISPLKHEYTNAKYEKDTQRIERIVYSHFNALHCFNDKEVMRKTKVIDQLACHLEMSSLTNWRSFIPQDAGDIQVDHNGEKLGELFLANSKLDSMGFNIPGDLGNMPEEEVLQNLFEIYTVMEMGGKNEH